MSDPYFISHVAPSASQEVSDPHGGKKQWQRQHQPSFGSFLMRLCFDTELLWLFFSPLIARIPTSAELWLIIFLCVCVEKGKHKAKEFFGEKESSMITMFHSSYLWTR